MTGAEVQVGLAHNPLHQVDQPAGAAQLRQITDYVDIGGGEAVITFDSAISAGGTAVNPGDVAFLGEEAEAEMAVVATAMRVQVPSSAVNTGQTASRYYTTYTKFNGSANSIDSTYLSFWCADCHNLDIGWYETLSTNFRGTGDKASGHSDRTHSNGTSYLQCYSCHRSDLTTPAVNEWAVSENFDADLSQGTATMTGTACFKCHYRPNEYVQQRDISDFPHSGKSSSTKLLKDRAGALIEGSTTVVELDGEAAYDASYEHIDSICVDCHNLIGSRE
jgi:hypothetical protein